MGSILVAYSLVASSLVAEELGGGLLEGGFFEDQRAVREPSAAKLQLGKSRAAQCGPGGAVTELPAAG